MARIKTIELRIKDTVHSININCSKSGIFSCTFSWELSEVLNLPHDVAGKTLQEIEDVIYKAYNDYINAVRTVRLVVVVQFKANRKFIRDEEGNVFPAFSNQKLIFHEGWGSNTYSILAFGYNILAEEDINGRKKYYDVIHEDKASYLVKNREKIGQYYCNGTAFLPNDCEVLEYSENLINNLQSIGNQLRNATRFLSDLFTSKDSLRLLSTEDTKFLTQK